MTTITAKFMWKECRPDNREFRQNSSLLEPLNFTFGVEIPVTDEYMFNSSKVLRSLEEQKLWELNPNQPRLPEESPIYTPKALQFCLDKLGEYLRDPEPEDFKAEVSDDWGHSDADDWSDDGKAETKSATTEDDGWSDAIDTDDKHKDEEKWNAESEDWS